MKNIINNEKSSNRKKYLNFEERKMIEKMIKEWLKWRSIAWVLWRWKTTIYDEIKNNSTFYDWYKAELAHKKFLRNQLLKRNKNKIETNPKLYEYIINQLKEDWSPEEISWRLKQFNNDKDLDNYIWYVCFETIYKFIYSKNWLYEIISLKLFLNYSRHQINIFFILFKNIFISIYNILI